MFRIQQDEDTTNYDDVETAMFSLLEGLVAQLQLSYLLSDNNMHEIGRLV